MKAGYRKTGDPATDRLMEQFITRVAKFARGGSVITLAKKIDRYRAFLRYIGKRFALEDIVNIQPRHVAGYIIFRRQSGVSEKTIVNEIAIIKGWHERILGRKYIMPENTVLFELEEKFHDKEFCKEIKNRYRVKGKRHRRRLQKPATAISKSL